MSVESEKRVPLDQFRPFLIAANVRAFLDESRYSVGPGFGQVGDLVLGQVIPDPGEKVVILDQDKTAHTISKPQRVLAVIGPRDSSTHVCAVIPFGGIEIRKNAEIHWVAGESGIVGCLESDPAIDSIHAAESAVKFRCCGLVLDEQEQQVNINEFAVTPSNKKVSVPIVLVSATSSESGKTILAGKIIRRLSMVGIKVGAIKATGTGGVLDSIHHEKSGALAVLDNVDAGLITTHGNADKFRQKIPLVFRQMATQDVEVIIAELGGDLLSANNPEIFSIKELMDKTVLLLVISNDALAAAGVNAVNKNRLGFPGSRIRHFSSPFRNHVGMSRRMSAAGIRETYDPCSPADLDGIVNQIIELLGRKKSSQGSYPRANS